MVSRVKVSAVVCGAAVVAGGQVLARELSNGTAAQLWSGLGFALALLVLRWLLGRAPRTAVAVQGSDDDGASLARWVERTESQITWSDTTRADWDRRVRPTLARQFELATRQPRVRDRAGFDAMGRVVFGDELWVWVDPDNVSPTGMGEPGPGRGVLVGVIERLERL